MADDVKTGIRLEAEGAADYKKTLKDAAAAGESLEESLKKVSEAEGDSKNKSDKLDNAIKGLRQESKTLSAEMKALESSFDESTTAEERAAAKKDLLNRQIETQRGLLLGLQEQLKEVTESEGENSTVADKQREAIYKAQTALNKMEGELRETEMSLDGATEATEELGEATQESGEKVSGFGDVLKANLASEAIVKGLEKTVELIKKAGAAAYGAAKDAAAYADTYLTMSTTTGLSTDELQEFAYMSELVDVSLDTLTGSMSKLITKMSSAASGNKSSSEAFQKLGVRVTKADGSLRDSREVFFEIIDALGKIQDPTERDAAAMELFGKKAQDLNPLIAQGSKGIKAFAEEAHRSGYVLDTDTLAKLGELDDSFQRLNNTKVSIANQFGAGFADSITNINTKLTDLAQNLDWEALGESAGNVLDTLSEKAFAFAESVDFENVGDKIESFFAYFDEHGEDIAKTAEAIGIGFASWKAVGVVKGVVGGVKELYGWLEAVGGLIGVGGLTAAGGIGLTALGAYEVANRRNDLKTIGTIGDGHELAEYADNVAYLEQKLQEAQAAFDNLALSGGDLTMAQDELALIQNALGNAREEYEAIKAAKEAADAAGPDPVEQAEQAAANAKAASGAAQELSEAGEVIQQESEKQLQAFSERTGEITSTFVEGTDEMSQAAVEGIQKTQDAMETNMAILNANAEIWGDDMMRSMANGILGGANNYVVAAVETVAKAIEERLGFSEPDKGPLSRFHEFAPDMMALFAQGIREGQGLLDAAIGDVFDLGPLIAAQNGGGQNFNYGGVNVTIYGAEGQSADELYDVFSQRLAQDVADREAVFSS